MTKSNKSKHLLIGALITLLQPIIGIEAMAATAMQSLHTTELMASEDAEADTPLIELSVKNFPEARGVVGEKKLVGVVHVKANGLEKAVSIMPSGAAEGIYSTDVTEIPAGTSEHDINIYYDAPKLGKHNGVLFFCCGDDILEQIRITGMAIDPANPPKLTVSPLQFKEFAAKVGEVVRDTIEVVPSGMPDYVKVEVTQNGNGFSSNTTMLYYMGTQKLVLSFAPKQEGEVTGTVTLYNEFIEPIEIPFKGKTVGDTPAAEKEGDELPLSLENPQRLLNEDFSGTAHNKPLKLEGWKNIAVQGQRAWWGYTFPEYDTENAGQVSAKITAFDSKVNEGEETECEMMLVTPPLDYVNSATRLFTFRVMGKNLFEGQNDTLEVCYIYLNNGEMVVEPLTVDIPAVADSNGKWMEFHIDLNGQNIEDAFFIGFRMKSLRGCTSSAIYFIDDVSYGRDDLPYITTSDIEMTVNAGTGSSADNEVLTLNLTEPVIIKVIGDDAEKFMLSTTELPATGGKFSVSVDAPKGEYWAVIQLSSKGASDKFVLAHAVVSSGVDKVEVIENGVFRVSDVTGRVVATSQATTVSEVLQDLPNGIYIVAITDKGKTKTIKIAK